MRLKLALLYQQGRFHNILLITWLQPLHSGWGKHHGMEIIQVLTNDNNLLREEKSIEGLSLQRVASATTKEPIQLCQKKNIQRC